MENTSNEILNFENNTVYVESFEIEGVTKYQAGSFTGHMFSEIVETKEEALTIALEVIKNKKYLEVEEAQERTFGTNWKKFYNR